MTSVDGAEWINWCVNLLYFVQLRAGPGYLIESIPENLYGTIEFYKVSLCKSPVALKSLLVNAYIRRHLWPSFLSTFHPRIDRPQTPRIPGDCQELLQKCHALLEKIPGRWEDVVHKGGENATKGRTTKIRQPTISNQRAPKSNQQQTPTNQQTIQPSISPFWTYRRPWSSRRPASAHRGQVLPSGWKSEVGPRFTWVFQKVGKAPAKPSKAMMFEGWSTIFGGVERIDFLRMFGAPKSSFKSPVPRIVVEFKA